MGVTGRLITDDSALGPAIAPTVIARDGDFDSESTVRDVRSDRVQLLTLAGFTSGEEFTIVVRLADGGYVAGGTTYTHGTDLTAAALQADLRTRTGDAALTVTGTSDTGPFTITHTPATFPRSYPKYRLVSAQGSGVFTSVLGGGDGTSITALGESDKVSDSDTILEPTIGTITVTPGVDKVDTLSFSAGTDGGTYELRNKDQHRVLAWNATAQTVYTQVREMYATTPGSVVGNAPTIRWATPLSMEVIFSAGGADFTSTDSAILTYDTTDASDALVASVLTAPSTAAAREALVVAWVKTIDAFAGSEITATEVVEDKEYDIVFHRTDLNALAVTDFALDVTNSADEDATPDENTAFSREAGIQFTYENGKNAGRVTVNRVVVGVDALTDGGVLEPATLTATTAGVLGSASTAYTETGSGDSVLVSAVHDTTGQAYGVQVDASTPAVITGLPPGAYHLVARTVEDGRVSRAANKAFTMTSA